MPVMKKTRPTIRTLRGWATSVLHDAGARGVDERPVRANRIRKSVGAENTFSSDLIEFEALVSELNPLVEKVWRRCESIGNRGPTVTLKVKFFDFEIITRRSFRPVERCTPHAHDQSVGRLHCSCTLGAWVEEAVMLIRTTRRLVFTQTLITVNGKTVARANAS